MRASSSYVGSTHSRICFTVWRSHQGLDAGSQTSLQLSHAAHALRKALISSPRSFTCLARISGGPLQAVGTHLARSRQSLLKILRSYPFSSSL
jgi:hypothetical protein